MQKSPKFGQIKNEKLGLHCQNKKLIVYISRLQKCVLNLTSTQKIAPKDQKNSPEGPKKVQEAQNVAKLKKMWLYLKNQCWLST